MRHRKKGKKFGKKTGRRRSFLRDLVLNLVRDEKIETTEARAKAIRPIFERLVTHAKRGNLASRRLILSKVHNKDAAEKVFGEFGPRFKERNGGYLRIVKLGKSRKRDGAAVVRIELV